MSAKQQPTETPRSDFWSSIRLLLTIVMIAAITMASQQFDIDPENLKIVGRITVTIGVIVLLYGLIKQMSKLIIVIAVLLLVGMVLVSEGIIDVPRLMGG